MPEITFTIAFIAGLLSFLSPCLLPMVPVYIAYLAGDTAATSDRKDNSTNLKAFLHALLFVAGFSVIFVLFGASATALGKQLIKNQILVKRLGAVIVIFLGLYMMGLFDLVFLERQRHFRIKAVKTSWVRAFLMGIAFSASWTPCVGPILASILVMASASETVKEGVLLLLAYSMGLGLPFLAVALFVDIFESLIKKHTTKIIHIKKVAGVILVAVGILMFFDFFSRFTYLWTPLL